MDKAKLNSILKNDDKVFRVKRVNSKDVVDKDFIKGLRNKLDFTQVVFASVLGVSIKTVEKWEQGSVEPRDMVKKFLYILNLHPDLIRDLYSFKSQENLEIAFSKKLGFMFEKSVLSDSIDNSFASSKKPSISEYKGNTIFTTSTAGDCCPAT